MNPLKIEVTEAMAQAALDKYLSDEPGMAEWVDETTRDYLRDLIAAAFQHPEFVAQLDRWLPIESAPKDGSEVLLADSDSVASGFYHDGSECYGHRGKAGFFCEEDRGNLLTASNFHATHWQPMPEPPRASLGRLLGEEG